MFEPDFFEVVMRPLRESGAMDGLSVGLELIAAWGRWFGCEDRTFREQVPRE
jgi:hypothetical protein